MIDTGRADVAAIAATLDADFAGTATLVPLASVSRVI